jgi:hypothetical protein
MRSVALINLENLLENEIKQRDPNYMKRLVEEAVVRAEKAALSVLSLPMDHKGKQVSYPQLGRPAYGWYQHPESV